MASSPSWLEAPALNRIHGSLVEGRVASRLSDDDLADSAILTDANLEGGGPLNPHPPGYLGVRRADLVAAVREDQRPWHGSGRGSVRNDFILSSRKSRAGLDLLFRARERRESDWGL